MEIPSFGGLLFQYRGIELFGNDDDGLIETVKRDRFATLMCVFNAEVLCDPYTWIMDDDDDGGDDDYIYIVSHFRIRRGWHGYSPPSTIFT